MELCLILMIAKTHLARSPKVFILKVQSAKTFSCFYLFRLESNFRTLRFLTFYFLNMSSENRFLINRYQPSDIEVTVENPGHICWSEYHFNVSTLRILPSLFISVKTVFVKGYRDGRREQEIFSFSFNIFLKTLTIENRTSTSLLSIMLESFPV